MCTTATSIVTRGPPCCARRTSSGAAPAQPRSRFHDGVYGRLGAGAAAFSDSVESEPLPIVGVAKGTIKGIGPALELALGGSVLPGLVVGGGVWLHSLPGPVASNG